MALKDAKKIWLEFFLELQDEPALLDLMLDEDHDVLGESWNSYDNWHLAAAIIGRFGREIFTKKQLKDLKISVEAAQKLKDPEESKEVEDFADHPLSMAYK